MQTAADIALILTPIIIGLGFYLGYGQWVSTRKARMAQLITLLAERWDSPEMVESRRRVNECGRRLKEVWEDADKAVEEPAFGSLIRVANFFDVLGVQVVEGFLDVRIAYDLFGKAEKTYYRLYDPLINSPECEEYVKCFRELHDLFVKEEARRSKTKKRRAS